MKNLRAEIAPGFVWEDLEVGHVVACGDATDAKFLKDLIGIGNVELVVADPPYQLADGASRLTSLKTNSKERRDRKDQHFEEKWDKVDDAQMEELLQRLASAAGRLAPHANVWVWTSDWWLSDVKRALRSVGLKVWPTYVWAKSNPPHSIRKACVASACEFLVMSSGVGAPFYLDNLPKQRSWFVAAPDGEFFPAVCPWWVERPVVHTVERLRRVDGEFLNRAQKPLDVIEQLVRTGSTQGGLVLDLFGGTGTALVAADRAKRVCYYVERDPEQVRAAARRLMEDRRKR